MPILEYRAQEFKTTHERQIIEEFVAKLKGEYSDKEETVIVLENYICNSSEIDATLLKNDGITVLEFKNYGGKIQFSANGDWTANDVTIKGGRDDRNPSQQVKDYKGSLVDFLSAHAEKILSQPREIDWGHVSGMVIFHQAIQFDKSTVPQPMRPWFQVTDLEKSFKALKSITSAKLFLSDEELRRIPILLGLKEVREDAPNNYRIEDILEKYRSYLESTAHTWEVKDYVHRPDIEIKLLNDKSHILFGAPGAGKSSLLKEMLRHQAKQLKNVFTRIPVLLENLVGDEVIVEKISGELGIVETEQTKQLLSDGILWIAFDGIDEIVRFKENIHHILSFIKRYPQNRYSITVQRETCENESYKSIFSPLKNFIKIEVGEFKPEERTTFLQYRMRKQFTGEQIQIFEEFSKSLPNANPLTVQMALEIFMDSAELMFENMGRFYQNYFQVYLKREVELSKELDRGTELLLHSILANLGKHSFNNDSNLIPKKDIYAYIKETVNEKITYIYNLLLRSEILKETPVIVPTGQDQKREVLVKFFHQSYRDYYTAESLSGKLTEIDSIENLVGKENEYFMITLLCGIETQCAINDQIIIFSPIKLAVDCLCNTRNVSDSTVTIITQKLCKIAKKGHYETLYVLDFIKRYGKICGADLFHTIEEVTATDPLNRIDWELIKHEKLGHDEIKSEYQFTPRYLYVKGNRINLPFLAETNSFSNLAYNSQAQNQQGYDYYLSLLKIDTVDKLIDNIFNTQINSTIRASSILDLVNSCRGGLISRHQVADLILNHHQYIQVESISFRWEIVPFFIYAMEPEEDSYPPPASKELTLKVIEYFWKETSGLIQFRILFGSDGLELEQRAQLYKDILTRYDNKENVELDYFYDLWEEEYYEELDYFFQHEEGDEPIAGEYELRAFRDEPYNVLIRCIALEKLGKLKLTDSRPVFDKFSFSENAKLKSIAEKALESLNNGIIS